MSTTSMLVDAFDVASNGCGRLVSLCKKVSFVPLSVVPENERLWFNFKLSQFKVAALLFLTLT